MLFLSESLSFVSDEEIFDRHVAALQVLDDLLVSS
jgi:hypothetical protein